MAGNKADNKSTDAEVESRITQVFNLLLIGVSRADVIQYASEKGWNVSDRQIDTYIKRANKQFKKHAELERNEELGRARVRLNKLYQASLKIQDYKGCLQVQKEINSLLGLYAPQKHDVSTSGEVTFKVIYDNE